MTQSTSDSGKKEKLMEKEFLFKKMGPIMKDNSATTMLKAKENI